MLPPPCSTIFGAAARQVANTVPKCDSSSSSNWAELMSRIDEPGGSAMPAQFTRMWMAPNSSIHLSTNDSADC